jgi:hypothetical protein
MPCDLIEGCQFFNDNMANLPKAAEYLKNKLCLGDYQSCSRYRIYQEYGGENLPPFLNPGDAEEVIKATQCLREKLECQRS